MSRRPDETTEQWNTRATREYKDAVEGLQVESTRVGLDQWRFSPGQARPLLDDHYQAAMDRLDLAEDERIEAAIDLDRERNHKG